MTASCRAPCASVARDELAATEESRTNTPNLFAMKIHISSYLIWYLNDFTPEFRPKAVHLQGMICLLVEWQIYYKTWSAKLFSLLGNKTLNWGLYASLTSFLAAPSSLPKFRVHPSGVGMAHITGTPSIPCSCAIPIQ